MYDNVQMGQAYQGMLFTGVRLPPYLPWTNAGSPLARNGNPVPGFFFGVSYTSRYGAAALN